MLRDDIALAAYGDGSTALFHHGTRHGCIALSATGPGQAHKPKAILECLDYLLQRGGASADINANVGRTIKGFPAVIPVETGY
ncbi:hypothetical protein [Sphingomonas sp. Leaf21]|uniref:hypothetical protein n=1 Tax=Sphingomonas sp. Leaf21 TaxID=2876550 RepID=UPI001E5DEF3D|nr:hypothetical protein [Sphingomonas sp. Leaf21]